MPDLTNAQIAKTIDHALLLPQLTDAEALAGCELAARYHVASVCVKPCHIELAVTALRDSDVMVGTVLGFPHGGSTVTAKCFEAAEAVELGADELDMVINIGKLRSGDVAYVQDEIAAVVEAAGGVLVKVIYETAYLSESEKIAGYHAAELAGAQFVKTSTGFATAGATVEDIRLMRATVGPSVQVKASGAVRDRETVLKMLEAGATRIGTSSTVAILEGVAPSSAGNY